MYLTKEDEASHIEAKQCMLCNEDFTVSNWKVRDHDHRTGEYRGACHNKCNINYFQNRYLPIFVHNLRGYDSHIILKQAFEIVEKKERIHAIPQSTEKFMTFSNGDLTFKYSFQFMAAGLGNLVEALISQGKYRFEHFHNMKKHFTIPEMELICKKGVYPYEWVDDNEKFKQEGLPPVKAFYSKLRLSGISKAEYKHAQNVYKTFNCKTFQDYHDLYLKTDVLVAADIFENFGTSIIAHDQLEPANFITAAS